jgi:hypothetical protein
LGEGFLYEKNVLKAKSVISKGIQQRIKDDGMFMIIMVIE